MLAGIPVSAELTLERAGLLHAADHDKTPGTLILAIEMERRVVASRSPTGRTFSPCSTPARRPRRACAACCSENMSGGSAKVLTRPATTDERRTL